MIRYLLVMAMIILTPPKGNGGMPLAPKPAVIEARVWDKLAAALSFVESRDDDRAYNAASGARGRPWTDRAGSYPLPCPLDWREGRKLDLIKKMNT